MTDFDTFWDIFPRKIGKGAARKTHAKALELTSAETLYWGARAYKAAMEGEDPRYVKMPATWLNQECWDDLYEVKKEWGMVTYSAASMRESEMREILNAVAKHFEIPVSELKGHCRTWEYSRYRQIYFYLARRLTDKTLWQIAKAAGCHHTTVMYGARVVEKRVQDLTHDLRVAAAVKKIEAGFKL